jgi:hypothetical protein
MSKLEELKEKWRVACAAYDAAYAAAEDAEDAAYTARDAYEKELVRCQNLKN